VERELKHLKPDERLQRWQSESKPLADAFKAWMMLHRQKVTDVSIPANVTARMNSRKRAIKQTRATDKKSWTGREFMMCFQSGDTDVFPTSINSTALTSLAHLQSTIPFDPPLQGGVGSAYPPLLQELISLRLETRPSSEIYQ
jgi:hypothetical protein